jgi:hypothetical protein
MNERRIIDYSRYRVAEAIVERFRAGADPSEIADEYDFGLLPNRRGQRGWIVELIVAAYDRRGTHRPGGGWR